MIRTLFLRGWSRWAAVIGGIACFVYLMTNRWWVGEWEGGVQAVTNTMVLLAPLVCFAAAVDVRAAMPNNGSSWMNSSTGSVSRVIALVLAIWLPSALVTVLLLLNVAAVNLAVSDFRLPGVVLLAPFAWSLLYAGIGVLAGRHLPLIAAAPIGLLAGFVLPVVFAATPDTRLAMLSPIDDGAVSPPILLRNDIVAVQISLCLVVSSVMIVLGFRNGLGKWTNAGLCLGLVGLLVLGSIGFTRGPERRYVAEDVSGSRTCDSYKGAEVCVWPDHRALLRPAVTAWASLRQDLPQRWKGQPAGFVERGLSEPQGWASFSTGTARSSVPELAMVMSGEIVSRMTCSNGEHAQPSTDELTRRLWLLYRIGALNPGQVPPQLKNVLKLPREAQEKWWLRRGAIACTRG